jgi:uncharacterized protein YbaR (Trm112 family)
LAADRSIANELAIYACPRCKRLLRQEACGLRCSVCSQAYPIPQGIPDFIGEELSQSGPGTKENALHRSDGTHLRVAVVVSDRSKPLLGISQPIPCTAGSYNVAESGIDQRPRARYRLRPRHLRPADCVPVEGSIWNRHLYGNASGKGRRTLSRKAFPTCISPGQEWRRCRSKMGFSTLPSVVDHCIYLRIP